MKPRHKRLILVVIALALLGLGATFVLKAFRSNLVFFYTPTEVFAGQVPQGQAFRIGGMVLEVSNVVFCLCLFLFIVRKIVFL